MFRLVEDRVALIEDENLSGGEKSPGGIVIPNPKSDVLYCKVVAAGPGKRAANVMLSDESVIWGGANTPKGYDSKAEARIPDIRLPMSVEEGDTVIISKYTGTKMQYEGKEYRVTTEPEILAIL